MSKAQQSCYSPRGTTQRSLRTIVWWSTQPYCSALKCSSLRCVLCTAQIRAGYGGGRLTRCFPSCFGSLSDNISFFCLRPDSLSWRQFSHGRQQVEWKFFCFLKSPGWLFKGIRNIFVSNLWLAGLMCYKHDSECKVVYKITVICSHFFQNQSLNMSWNKNAKVSGGLPLLVPQCRLHSQADFRPPRCSQTHLGNSLHPHLSTVSEEEQTKPF